MSNPPGPDRDGTSDAPVPDRDAETTGPTADAAAAAGHGDPVPDEQVTDSYPVVSADSEAATQVFATEALTAEGAAGTERLQQKPPERRFTAPGFDAGQTEVIPSVPEAPTEVIHTQQMQWMQRWKAAPQLIPPRLARKLPMSTSRRWGWVLALTLIILTLAVIAVLGTLWLTRDSRPKASQEDRVRTTIQTFDIAVQTGDLATLRSITCGAARDGYVNYNDQAWDDTYRRITAAKQYPVVASIDEVVVNGDHAEANVTAFTAYAPQIRSTRSFDLQYRDDQWKICQSRTD